ncbi:hypothetical protein [Aquiflexum gelatinilyticum]|nr:hypothetical protein [Aquiflexum gelatinilyticum]MCS4435427.1 hypothetical protein [Aquiflexum gelatinilyticum]
MKDLRISETLRFTQSDGSYKYVIGTRGRNLRELGGWEVGRLASGRNHF